MHTHHIHIENEERNNEKKCTSIYQSVVGDNQFRSNTHHNYAVFMCTICFQQTLSSPYWVPVKNDLLDANDHWFLCMLMSQGSKACFGGFSKMPGIDFRHFLCFPQPLSLLLNFLHSIAVSFPLQAFLEMFATQARFYETVSVSFLR